MCEIEFSFCFIIVGGNNTVEQDEEEVDLVLQELQELPLCIDEIIMPTHIIKEHPLHSAEFITRNMRAEPGEGSEIAAFQNKWYPKEKQRDFPFPDFPTDEQIDNFDNPAVWGLPEGATSAVDSRMLLTSCSVGCGGVWCWLWQWK